MLRALMAALVLVVGFLVVPTTASAEADYLDVRITAVSTPVLNLSDPQQVVELKGTITNTSTVAIEGAVVHFWRLPTPIRSEARLDELEQNLPIGSRITDEASLYQFPKDVPFGPGERADFSVKVTIAQLTQGRDPLVKDGAAYLIGAQVRGVPEGESRAIVGSDTFPITATTAPVRSSALVVLSATPSWLPDGSFTDSSLAADLEDRLDPLLASAEREGVQAAIDPALYEAVTRLSGTHTVDGASVEGNGIALRWVQRVDALAGEGRLWRLPYGDPDLTRAALSGQLDTVMDWSAEAGNGILPEVGSVAILRDGASPDLVDHLSDLDTVVVSGMSGATSGTPQLLGARSIGATARPDGGSLPERITREFLAVRPPLYLIDSVQAADADADLGTWREHVAPSAKPSESLTWPETTSSEPWPDLADTLTQASKAAELLDDLTDGPSSVNLAVLGATSWSSGFSDQRQAVAYAKSGSPPDLDLKKVNLRAAASFVMGSRTNTFPATLTNELSVPVTVGVTFQSDSPQRIRVPNVKPVTVEPGESVTLDVTPEATANGVALVRGQVVTTGGVAVGKPVTIEITATDFGRVGWIIILVSGAVLLGGTAWRIRAVRRERAKASAEVSE